MLKTINVLFTTAFSATIIVSIYFGWTVREKHYLTAEEGIGYALGIIGGTMMLVLLLYPARKNFRFMKNMLPVRYWFRLHMVLGVIGPVLIIFHSGFYLGSTNSTVAFFSMLTVALSGLFGRYFYSKIHHGLYGRRKTLDELLLNIVQEHNKLHDILDFNAELLFDVNEINRLMTESAQSRSSSLFGSLRYSRNATIISKKLKQRLKQSLRKMLIEPQIADSMTRKEIRLKKKQHLTAINTYANAIQQKAAFTVYEKFFSLWHVLHVPLFILLVITSFFHVYAVHIY